MIWCSCLVLSLSSSSPIFSRLAELTYVLRSGPQKGCPKIEDWTANKKLASRQERKWPRVYYWRQISIQMWEQLSAQRWDEGQAVAFWDEAWNVQALLEVFNGAFIKGLYLDALSGEYLYGRRLGHLPRVTLTHLRFPCQVNLQSPVLPPVLFSKHIPPDYRLRLVLCITTETLAISDLRKSHEA